MSDCWFYQVQCQATEAANKVAENVVITWARALLDSLEKIMIKVGTFWIDKSTAHIGGEGSAAWDVRYLTAWLSGVVFFGSLIMAAMMLMLNSRGDDIRKIMMGIIKMVVVSGAAFKVIDLMIDASDAFSKWVIETAIGAADGKFVTKLLNVASIQPNGIGWALIALGCLVGIAANLIQFAMMECREAILPLVAGIIPLAASAALTDWGQQWLRKTTSWVISFIMMKPAAAIIYAVAIKMVSGASLDPAQRYKQQANQVIGTVTRVVPSEVSVGEDMGMFIRGLIMMVLAAVALPALIRLITPAAEAMGVGGGALAATAGAVSVITGAIRVARSTGGSGSAGPPGSSGANGTPGTPGPGGAMGPAGSGGTTGAVGTGGATGAAGAAGASGATGATGATGAAGASGAGASGAAAGAGAAAGPAAVVMVGAEAAHKGVQVARSTGNAAAASGGPSGGGA